MSLPILTRNKQTFLQYNHFRKQIFYDLAPKAGEAALYLLPWLLSVNHEKCPGYIPNLERPFKVFNVDTEREIRHRESVFKRMFGIKENRSLLLTGSNFIIIQGLYTIGSVGSISQTSSSDCDIWVCCNKHEFTEVSWAQLHQKINLIKDWMDLNIKMQVFFFISDVEDVQKNHFGSVDAESSGSTQKNLLKEEFYRTSIVICGKIPLWWLCFDGENDTLLDYEEALSIVTKSQYNLFDVIDFGDLTQIEKTEYFGAALWQLQKSLRSPLKSIIKMIQVKILLDSPDRLPLCYQLRKAVLTCDGQESFPDPSVLTMKSILEHYGRIHDLKTQRLLKECFYLRCDIKPLSNQVPLKNHLIKDLLTQYPIGIKKRIRLSRFSGWDFNAQINLGNRLFRLLLNSYRDISTSHAGMANEINKRDFNIIGRKILTSYQKKDHKIRVLQKPRGDLNLPYLTLYLKDKDWQVFSGNNKNEPLVTHPNILYVIAFIVWNDLFEPSKIRMEPNPSSVTLQEILNLGRKMEEFFGTFDALEVDLSQYLKKEKTVKLLVAVSFEKAYYEKDINDFGIIYKNSWGELFVENYNSPRRLEAFIKKNEQQSRPIETNFYVQRNSTYYEKIIERTKRIMSSYF